MYYVYVYVYMYTYTFRYTQIHMNMCIYMYICIHAFVAVLASYRYYVFYRQGSALTTHMHGPQLDTSKNRKAIVGLAIPQQNPRLQGHPLQPTPKLRLYDDVS